jgi:UDP-glucose 4-epimerase
MSRLVLVTGGAGFIGSHLVDALLARGDRVRVLDDFSTGRRENLAHCLADIGLFEGDVRDPGLVGRAVAGCDGVLHEAAVASVTRSLEDPEGTASVTHGGTVNVADRARRAGAGGFVLASSCAVYGDTTALPIREDSPPRPLSPYALAKLLAEGVCGPRPIRPAEGLPERLSASREVDGGQQTAADEGSREMRAVSLRYFNVYGPRQDPSSEYSGVIARFMEVAAARASARSAGGGEQTAGPGGPPYVVYGDGRQSRDFVFVTDVVAANLLALDACLAGGRASPAAVDGAVVNVGTGVRVDLLEIVRLAEGLSVGSEAGSGGLEAAIDFRPPREGDITASQADIARARRLLGYEPAVSFADGLAETYSWYVAQGVS